MIGYARKNIGYALCFDRCSMVLNHTSRTCCDWDGGCGGCSCGSCGSYALFVGVVDIVFRSRALSHFYSTARTRVGEMDGLGFHCCCGGDVVV